MHKTISYKIVFVLILNLKLISTGKIYAQSTNSVKTTNLGKTINSSYADFAPVISADGSTIMFTSTRPVTEKEIKSGRSTFERIFVSYYNSEKQNWSNAVAMPDAVNATGRNNSAIALSNDAQKMLLYRDDKTGNGDIYESVLNGSTWSEAIRLPEPVNSNYHESSACYSPDGNTLYFVSNRKGGIGGRDIWQCTRKMDGKWSDATLLPAIINTKDDEEGVFLHPDGITLYFSSKSHSSIGGYDVFTSVKSDGKWTLPVSMGSGINSKEHDVFFVMEANGQKGYYASAKSGGNGMEDIYLVEFLRDQKEKGPKLTLLKGIVTDAQSGLPIEASLEITDNNSGEKITVIKSNAESGKYLISLSAGHNYGINVNASGYLFYSVNVSMPDTADYNELTKNIVMQKLEVGSLVTLNNIFYDFDKATLRSESISELNKLFTLINNNPGIQVEIGSHTDNRGSEEYNLLLSQSRAQSVIDYLIKQGISSQCLIAKGYGKSRPIADNNTEEGRQLNRRTEFKILKK